MSEPMDQKSTLPRAFCRINSKPGQLDFVGAVFENYSRAQRAHFALELHEFLEALGFEVEWKRSRLDQQMGERAREESLE